MVHAVKSTSQKACIHIEYGIGEQIAGERNGGTLARKRSLTRMATVRRIQLSFFTFSVKLIPKWENCEAIRMHAHNGEQFRWKPNDMADYYYCIDIVQKGCALCERVDDERTHFAKNIYFIVKYLRIRVGKRGKWWVSKSCAQLIKMANKREFMEAMKTGHHFPPTNSRHLLPEALNL